jgi:hypothetical protein
MKAFKISLAVAVIAVIATGVIMWITSIDEPPKIPLQKNQFIAKIEQEIEQLSQRPNNIFCKEFYDEVAYHINDFYRQNRFGSNQSENNQWKENFEKNLYSAYAAKFIQQASYVFRGSVWNNEDLRFIRGEYQALRESPLLEKSSPVDKKFTEIQTIFSKYDEITGFISSCRGFSYSNTGLSARFPISDVQRKIARAASYLNNHLGNEYVNHCSRLQDGLREIPRLLFRAHVNYLDNKINTWSGFYSNYNSHADYVNNLNRPIRNEIEALDNNTYHAPNFNNEYNRLSNRWSADNTRAYNYSYPKI